MFWVKNTLIKRGIGTQYEIRISYGLRGDHLFFHPVHELSRYLMTTTFLSPVILTPFISVTKHYHQITFFIVVSHTYLQILNTLFKINNRFMNFVYTSNKCLSNMLETTIWLWLVSLLFLLCIIDHFIASLNGLCILDNNTKVNRETY